MKRRQFRKKIPLVMTLAVIVLVIVAYVLGLAWYQARQHAYYEFTDLIEPRVIDVVIVSWLVYFCSSIGSFLNVVAWRMPRGQGIGGRSRCPRCAALLKSRDNVPILGWISLRGRCRSCGLPISRRYPIVEGLVGLSLTAVGVSEIYSLCLPGQLLHWHGGPLWTPQVTLIQLAILTFHAIALTVLWAMSLIRIDGVRLPTRMIAVSGLLVVGAMLALPTVMVVPWQAIRPLHWTPDGLYVDAIMRAITGLVAAAFYGRLLAKGLCPTADLKLDPLGRGTFRLLDLIAMLSVPALVIGWQSMPAIVIVSAIGAYALRPLLNALPINDGPTGQISNRGVMESFAFALPMVLAIHLVFWRLLWSTPYWPSDRSGTNVIILWALLSLTVPLFLFEPSVVPDPSVEPEGSADELPEDGGNAESDNGDHRRDDSPSP